MPLARGEEVLTVNITSSFYVFLLEVRQTLAELSSVVEVLLPSKLLCLLLCHLEFLEPPYTTTLSLSALTLINTLLTASPPIKEIILKYFYKKVLSKGTKRTKRDKRI